MFGIGLPELVVILVIALLVLGPEKMPQLARDVGRTVGELRKTSDELREEFLNADRALKGTDGPAAADPGGAPAAAPGEQPPAKPPSGPPPAA